MLESLMREVRQAFRVIRQAPGFTAVVVLTLALGTGANTAIFSVVNAVILRPFPFDRPGQLAVAWEMMPPPGDRPMYFSPPNFEDVREHNRSFRSLSAFAPGPVLLATDAGTVRLVGARVSGNLFETLGVGPAAGRSFGPDDDRRGAPRVAILSDRLWRSVYGGDPGVIGRRVVLDGESTEIIGIMPESFAFPPPIDVESSRIPVRHDLWLPLAEDPASASRDAHYLTVIGRLRDDATAASATEDLVGISGDLAATFPASNANWSARAIPLQEVALGNIRPALFALLAAVGVVLLIACVNVANLLLARATGRQKEFAIRAALGANRPRLVRQALVESQVFAILGGAAGLALAWAGTRVLIRIAPPGIPRIEQAGIDGTAAFYALAIAIVTGLMFGLVPALRVFAPDLSRWLREGVRTGGAGSTQVRLRDGLVVAEIALSFVLLVGAGLLFRTFLIVRGIDPGFVPDDRLTMRLSLPPSYGQPAARVAFFRAVGERVRALPGVEAAGFSLDVPLASDFQGTEMVIEGAPPPGSGRRLANFSLITPGYAEAMGIRIVAGRDFGDADAMGAEGTVLINEAAARQYFTGTDPIGQRIDFAGSRRIVGIVGDVRLESLTAEPFPAMYFPFDQVPDSRSLSLVLRMRGGAGAVVPAVRSIVRDVDPGVPVHDVRALREILSDTMAAPRFSSAMLLIFSLTALMLAAVGIYGVMSHATSMRTREIGVRMAIGARPVDALRLVLTHALALAGAGIGLGLAAALLLTRYLRALLFGVGAADPIVLAAMTSFLLLATLVAGAIPAWRAARVDPLIALRFD